jgi:ribonuclease D
VRHRLGSVLSAGAVVNDELPTITPRWIADGDALDELIDELLPEPRYAVDTEFHRERTYYPKLALLQVGWSGGIALIDPLAVDVAPFAKVLDGGGLALFHAAQQDLEVLGRATGTLPARMFDTQVAAGFLGYSTPSLATLVAGELHEHLPKGDRLTDWLARPLTQDQKTYAAADVAHLPGLHDRLTAQLEAEGRLAWAHAECEELRIRPTGPGDPEDAWLRLKDVRTLRGQARGVARAVAAWRERRAAELDQPARFVLADLAVLSIAQKAPRTPEALRSTRGVEDRHARGNTYAELSAAITAGVTEAAPATPERDENALDRNLRPALPDHEPHTEVQPGRVRINGLFRHGWLLAPALVDDALRALALREGVAA